MGSAARTNIGVEMDRLVAMEIFRAVAESGSFVRAADLLHISAASTSRNVSELERHLGTTLLRRSTRSVLLTEVGAKYYEHCCDILDRIADAEGVATDAKSELSGRLRISMPTTFGLRYVAPLIDEFLKRYPLIEADLWFSDQEIDFVEDPFDIAIRISRSLKTSLIARELGAVRILVVAAPGYLKQRGIPTVPDDLREHDCLTYAYAAYGDTWRFVKDGVEHITSVKTKFRSNSGDMLRMACINGAGISVQPTFIVGDDLRSGELVQLLPDFHFGEYKAYAVYPVDGRRSARTRAFVEFVSEAFNMIAPSWDRDLTLSH
jgi:DNA-binding transcriptional LysR family regulator